VVRVDLVGRFCSYNQGYSPAIGCSFFGKENEGGNPDAPGNKEQILAVNCETPPYGPHKIDPFPSFAPGEPVCATPHYLEEEGQRPAFPYAVDAQRASEQWVMAFTGTRHDKLAGLSFGDDRGSLDPHKVDTGHDLLIGQDRCDDLFQLVTLFVPLHFS